MDDDQRAALVGYLLMRPVVERIELCVPRFNRRVASASLIMRMFSWGSWPLE